MKKLNKIIEKYLKEYYIIVDKHNIEEFLEYVENNTNYCWGYAVPPTNFNPYVDADEPERYKDKKIFFNVRGTELGWTINIDLVTSPVISFEAFKTLVEKISILESNLEDLEEDRDSLIEIELKYTKKEITRQLFNLICEHVYRKEYRQQPLLLWQELIGDLESEIDKIIDEYIEAIIDFNRKYEKKEKRIKTVK